MLTLIAESKTMTAGHSEKSGVFSGISQLPRFEEDAEKIVDIYKSKNNHELSEMIGLTPALGSKAVGLFYDFGLKDNGIRAIDSYSGDVYKALDFPTLSTDAKERAFNDLRIISSLYGIVTPSDLVKPYRLEFKAKCTPLCDNLEKFWKSKVTIYLGKLIKEKEIKEVLNLLPGDADKYIDWKLLKAFVDTVKPVFKVVDERGNLQTPNAGKLKEMRGKFLRTVLEENLSATDLLSYGAGNFRYSEDDSKPGLPIFIETI